MAQTAVSSIMQAGTVNCQTSAPCARGRAWPLSSARGATDDALWASLQYGAGLERLDLIADIVRELVDADSGHPVISEVSRPFIKHPDDLELRTRSFSVLKSPPFAGYRVYDIGLEASFKGSACGAIRIIHRFLVVNETCSASVAFELKAKRY